MTHHETIGGWGRESLRVCATVILLMMAPAGVLARDPASGLITGRITDSVSAQPLEKAIVFLAGTPLGGSTAADGLFRIAGIPPGEYEIIVSRVGYERRSIPVKIGGSDSLYYTVKLSTRMQAAQTIRYF